MSELFLKIIVMSISASWLVLAVLILRLVLKKAPKWMNVLLWGIVAIRLICPFTIESPVSMIPDSVGSGKFVSEWMDDYVGNVDIHHSDSVYYDAAIGAGREPISDGDEKVIKELGNERLYLFSPFCGLPALRSWLSILSSVFGVCGVRSAKRLFLGRTST